MTREVSVSSGAEPLELMAALRNALAGDGPAILPLAPGAPVEASPGEVPRAVAVVVQTSGSTDAPKRVMLTANALLSSAAASSGVLGGPGQWLLALPTHYIAGVQVLVRSIAAESIPIVVPPGSFDPVTFAESAEALTGDLPLYTSLVPAQLARVIEGAREKPRVLDALRRFTAVLVGGQAVPPHLIDDARELDVRVVRTYGSSETAGGCVYDGNPIGNTRLRLGPGGELHVSGAVLAEGYLGNPALTARRFLDEHGERWYRTGDRAELDETSGEVRVLGRLDNVIISGGVKVSLDAVERLVRSLPGFDGAIVVGAADETWGEVPVVLAERAARDAATQRDALAELRDAVGAVLGKAARPARVVTVDEIPLLPSGKPDRLTLRQLAAG